MLQSTLAPILAQRSISASTRDGSSDRAGSIDEGERPAKKKGKKKKKGKSTLRDGGRGGGGEGAGASLAPPLDDGGMVYGFDQQDHESAYVAHRGAKGWIPGPVARAPAPTCCPPDRCTGDRANHAIWPQLDDLLYETCVAAFKCEFLLSSRARAPALTSTNRRAHRQPRRPSHLHPRPTRQVVSLDGRTYDC